MTSALDPSVVTSRRLALWSPGEVVPSAKENVRGPTMNRGKGQLAELPPTTQAVLGAILDRRSRRFGKGMEMPGAPVNPLAFKSREAPKPLTLAQEAAIAMSATAITGYANAELPLHNGPAGDGGVLVNMVGRAIASPDAAHCTSLVVINDEGVWFVKRPQNFSAAELKELIALKEQGRIVDMYQRMRVKIADGRRAVPRDSYNTPTFNAWDHNRPGSTVFLPVIDLSTIQLAALMSFFNEEHAFNVLDESRNYALAGTKAHGKKKGGHLSDNLKGGRMLPVDAVDNFVQSIAAIEAGEMIAHMALVGSTLQSQNVGGFPHAMATPTWTQVLGFQHQAVPLHKLPGMHGIKKLAVRVLGQTAPVATKLEHDGVALLKPFTPENFPSAPGRPSMEGAVTAFLEHRFGPTGTMRDDLGPWKDNKAIKSAIKPPSPAVVRTVVDYASYIYDRYGKFPSETGPLMTVTGYQAHRLDGNFYASLYQDKTTRGAP